jgi:cytochrome c oxidase subunit 3
MMADLKIENLQESPLRSSGKKIHPYKFTLWVGIASIIMMFAGFTSAFLVRRNQANWVVFELPTIFWYSTALIILSSITMFLAQKNFAYREMTNYRSLLTATMILGILFILLQIVGFYQLMKNGTPLGKTNSVDFLYVIVWTLFYHK